MGLYAIRKAAEDARLDALFQVKACVDSDIEPLNVAAAAHWAELVDRLSDVLHYIDTNEYWRSDG